MNSPTATTYHDAVRERIFRHIASKPTGQPINPEFFRALRWYGVDQSRAVQCLDELSEAGRLLFFNVPNLNTGAITWAKAAPNG